MVVRQVDGAFADQCVRDVAGGLREVLPSAEADDPPGDAIAESWMSIEVDLITDTDRMAGAAARWPTSWSPTGRSTTPRRSKAETGRTSLLVPAAKFRGHVVGGFGLVVGAAVGPSPAHHRRSQEGYNGWGNTSHGATQDARLVPPDQHS